jgi:hypothetical protein
LLKIIKTIRVRSILIGNLNFVVKIALQEINPPIIKEIKNIIFASFLIDVKSK